MEIKLKMHKLKKELQISEKINRIKIESIELLYLIQRKKIMPSNNKKISIWKRRLN